ncbi:MAG: Gfo/Idh/MocA family oxidoreductase [Clostridia bacterium]|nr:Gfo/Idh/MocA family oxidoreductase [Clostridia bacterium]
MADMNAFEKNQEVKVVDANHKVRVGIIGTGWIADAHIEAYKRQPDVEVVAACDLIPGKAAAFMAKHGVEGVKTDYANDREMIDDKSLKLDAVSICTYNRQHAGPAIYALDNGINVLLEKPMCVTIEEAAEICRAEKRSGKVISIGFQPRFSPNMQMIKKIVQSGELGDIYYVQTGGGRRRGIPTPFGTTFIEDATAGLGALADIGCYSLDLVLNALGNPKPLTVSGYKSAFFGTNPKYSNYVKINHPEYAEKFGVDDFAAAFIRLEGGITLDFRIAWAMNINTPGDTIFLGTKGGLRVPSTDCWNGTLNAPMTIYHEVAGEQVETVVPLLKDINLWDAKVRSFLDACKYNGKAPVPTSDIIYNQAILDGIAKSSDAGREIEIVIPEI